MQKATLKINIWTREGDPKLPDTEQELGELFVPHLEYVAGLCAQGYHSGQILDERFQGWWSVNRE
jgi:hypothetical protein